MAQEIIYQAGMPAEDPNEKRDECFPDMKLRTISSAALAFLGDSVFELKIRSKVVCAHDESADDLNKRSKALTNAKAQAVMAGTIQDLLTAEELAVYKRGRNFKSVTAPKSCTISEYRRATGLEALMGYLFLKGDQKRIDELITAGTAVLNTGREPSNTSDD